MIKKLEEKAALFESTSSQLKHELLIVRSELINSRKDLDTQRFTFERQLEAEAHRLLSRIDSLKECGVAEYNSGLSFCYDCIMFVLKKEYPELNMNKLEGRVNAHMDKHNKEGEKEVPPQPIEGIFAQPVDEVVPQPTEEVATSTAQKSSRPNAGPSAVAS